VPKTPGSYRLGPLGPVPPDVQAANRTMADRTMADRTVGPTPPDHDLKRALAVRRSGTGGAAAGER